MQTSSKTSGRTDGELLAGVLAGESSAFVEFVERHHDAVERWLRHMIGHRAEVDDILQETFLVVLQQPQSFHGSGSARPWVFGIARHRLAREFRRRTSEPAHFEPLEELGLRAGWGDPEAGAELAETRQQVHEAFGRLSEEAREILFMRDVEGFTTPETAETLNITVPAAKSRLHRARLALMAELEGVEAVNG